MELITLGSKLFPQQQMKLPKNLTKIFRRRKPLVFIVDKIVNRNRVHSDEQLLELYNKGAYLKPNEEIDNKQNILELEE